MGHFRRPELTSVTAHPRQGWVARGWVLRLLPPFPGHLTDEGHRVAHPGWIVSVQMPSMPQKFLLLLNYRLCRSYQPPQLSPTQAASIAITSAKPSSSSHHVSNCETI